MDATRAVAIQRHPLRPSELLRRLRDPSPPVAGLVLDLCGVLYDDSAWPRWLLKLVHRLGLHTNYTPFFRVWRREYLERVKRGELEYWQALRLFLRAAGLTSAQIDEVEAAGHGRYRAYEMELLPLPGVGTVLSRLNELGIPLTMLSTSYLGTEEVRRRLETLGLDTHFQNVLAVPDLWRSHPDRSPFEVASEVTDLAARRTGFVGRDSAALAEAGMVGMRRIAVNCDDDALADVFLRSFDRLPDSVPWDVPVSQSE